MLELDLSFNGVTMKTTIYVKAETTEQLLLGEGACHQLRIITYHLDVSDRRGRKWQPPELQPPSEVGGERIGDDELPKTVNEPNTPRAAKGCGPGHEPEKQPASPTPSKGMRRKHKSRHGRHLVLPSSSGNNMPGPATVGFTDNTPVERPNRRASSGTQTTGRDLQNHSALDDTVNSGHITIATQTEPDEEDTGEDPGTVAQVRLLQTVRVPARQSIIVRMSTEAKLPPMPVVFEPDHGPGPEVYSEDCLVVPGHDITIQILITNPSTASRVVPAGELLGQAYPATVVETRDTKTLVGRIQSVGERQLQDEERMAKLEESIGELDLPPTDKEALLSFLTDHH